MSKKTWPHNGKIIWGDMYLTERKNLDSCSFLLSKLVICFPNMHSQNSPNEIKSKIGARFLAATHRLLAHALTDWATQKAIIFSFLF